MFSLGDGSILRIVQGKVEVTALAIVSLFSTDYARLRNGVNTATFRTFNHFSQAFVTQTTLNLLKYRMFHKPDAGGNFFSKLSYRYRL